MKDFYSILGIDSNCTAGDIKDAYRKLSKKFHPDFNDGDKYFENRFREINEAYETLNDPAKRFQYDLRLKKIKAKDRNPAYVTSSTKIQPKLRFSAFTITLIVVVFVLCVYLVESFSHIKKRILQSETVETITPANVRKHHKPKHITKAYARSPEFHVDSTPAIVINPQPVIKPNTEVHNKDFLYTTYVHANLTGVVNMRQADNFNSDIIVTIPDNSKVFVLEKGNLYYKVFFNNNIGYIPKWSLQLK